MKLIYRCLVGFSFALLSLWVCDGVKISFGSDKEFCYFIGGMFYVCLLLFGKRIEVEEKEKTNDNSQSHKEPKNTKITFKM